MAKYTIEQKGRGLDKLKLDEAEAWAMLREGFRFSEFNPTTDTYTLSIPYSLGHSLGRPLIFIEQP